MVFDINVYSVRCANIESGEVRQMPQSGEGEMKATCAKCGSKRDLCDSPRIEGIKEPRICQECLIEHLATGELKVSDLYYVIQLKELDDTESLNKLNDAT